MNQKVLEQIILVEKHNEISMRTLFALYLYIL
jgi:hypothetical protein